MFNLHVSNSELNQIRLIFIITQMNYFYEKSNTRCSNNLCITVENQLGKKMFYSCCTTIFVSVAESSNFKTKETQIPYKHYLIKERETRHISISLENYYFTCVSNISLIILNNLVVAICVEERSHF